MTTQDFRLTLLFLTTLPVKPLPDSTFQPERLSQAARWFPTVGLLIGIILIAANGGLALFLPCPAAGPVRAVLITGTWVLITGGLHLDGLADCCDGLLAPVTRPRRLEIMHDPRLGAFGVTGLVLLLALKGTTIAALSQALPALLLAPVWARWLLLVAARQPAAQPTGMGATFAAGLSRPILIQALVVPLLALGCVSFITGFDLRALWGIVLAGLFTAGCIRLARHRLGGMTGDVYGLVVEVSEAAVLLVYVAG